MLPRIISILAILGLALASPANAQLRTYQVTQITSDQTNHFNPNINDLGRVGWCVAQGSIYQSFFTLTEGLKLARASCIVAAGSNFKEMVWIQNVGGYSQIFSSRRGQVTRSPADHLDPAVNSQGEIVGSSRWVARLRFFPLSRAR